MAEDLRAYLFCIEQGTDQADRGWGWVGLVASARGLRYLGLPTADHGQALRRLRKYYQDAELVEHDAFLEEAARQVEAYLRGHSQEFAVELDLRGHTAFELSVWAITAHIGYGETRTYGWIAGQLGGNAGTAQAVGAALGNNPVPLIVPCHRVIGSDGSLHGFAGGLDMKARLLAMEQGQLRLPLD